MTNNETCTVLIVEKDTSTSQILKNTLELVGMRVLLVPDHSTAIDVTRKAGASVIITSVSSEDLSGFDLLGQVNANFTAVKVIMVAECNNHDLLKQVRKENAYDLLITPLPDPESIVASVQRACEASVLISENNSLKKELQVSGENIASANERLTQLSKNLRNLSITDGLTQLHNRRYIDDWIQNYALYVDDPDANYSVILIDIDYFKNTNDSLGHDGGDKVLKHLASILNEISRDEDLVGRYGGEEFILVMPGTDEKESIKAAERIRKKIENAVITVSSGTTQITASLGVSTNMTSIASVDTAELTSAEAFFSGRELISQAEEALYAAKHSGRNQSIHYNYTKRQLSSNSI